MPRHLHMDTKGNSANDGAQAGVGGLGNVMRKGCQTPKGAPPGLLSPEHGALQFCQRVQHRLGVPAGPAVSLKGGLDLLQRQHAIQRHRQRWSGVGRGRHFSRHSKAGSRWANRHAAERRGGWPADGENGHRTAFLLGRRSFAG